jgi:hypothetical protein
LGSTGKDAATSRRSKYLNMELLEQKKEVLRKLGDAA